MRRPINIPRRLPAYFIYDWLNNWADANPGHRPAVEQFLGLLLEHPDLERRLRLFLHIHRDARIEAIADALSHGQVDVVISWAWSFTASSLALA
jgi:hypothetical protein